MSPTQSHQHGAQPEKVAKAQRLERDGRFDEAAEAWSNLAKGIAGPARAEALSEQARLVANALGDPEAALRLHRRVLANDPTRRPSLDALLDSARRESDWLRVALLTRLRFEAARTSRERVALTLEAGRIEMDRLHNPVGARRWLEMGLEVDPAATALHEALADVERARFDDEALLASLERASELRGNGASPATLLEAATLRSERGDHEEALSHLERAARIAPDDALVLDALGDALDLSERYAELADVLERRSAIALDDPNGRAATLVELAELYEDRLFDPEAALDAYRRGYATDPTATGAQEGLARLGAKLEPGEAGEDEGLPSPSTVDDPEGLLRQHEQEASRTTDRVHFGRLVREIEGLHTRLGTGEAALPWIQRWARLAPEEPEALRALARIHARPGHEPELCASLEALDAFLALAEQAENRRRLGGLYIHRGMYDAAVGAFERSLEIEPASIEALEGLVWVRRESAQVPELITAQWRLAEQLEPPRRGACLSGVARLQEQQGDLAGAVATLTWIERDGDPGSISAAEEGHLDQLLERLGRSDELLERLSTRAAGFEPERPEAVALDLRRASLLLSVEGRANEAAGLYRDLIEREPESSEAKSGLESALRAGIDFGGLADFLADRSHGAPDSETRERSALERGVLLEEMLSRAAEAQEIYRALSWEASLPELRTEASQRYERLLERSAEWEPLRDHLEARAAAADAGEEEPLRDQLAQICETRLADPEAALAHLERVAELNPGRGDIWRRLADRYERDGRNEDWLTATRAELSADPEPGRELTLHARLAEWCVAAEDRPGATEHYARVFDLNPGHTTAAGYLIARYREEGRPEDVLGVLESRLATLGAHDDADAEVQRTALRMQIAEVHDAEQGDVEAAISALEVALGEAGPGSAVALPLASCYARAGYDLDLIQLCRDAAAASPDAAERANWLVRLGDTFLERSETRDAADAYRQALSHRPDDRSVQASLRELHRQHGDTAALAQLLEAELAHLAGSEEIPVRLELAELLADPAQRRAPDALNHTRRVLQLEPGHIEAFERAVDLACGLGEAEGALDLIDERLNRVRNNSQRSDLEARRARILAGQTSRVDDAVAAFERAIEMAVDPRPLRDDLASLLEREGRTAPLLALLDASFADLPRNGRVAAIEHAVALAGEILSPDLALPWLARLREERPTDPSVLARIADIHRTEGRRNPLLQTLDAQAQREIDPGRKRDLHLERARLLEERNEAGRAAHALMDASDAAPEDAGIRRELARVQAGLGWHADRARTLEALLEHPSSDALALRGDLAELCVGPLCAPERAVVHLRAALDLVEPESPQAVELLKDLAGCQRALGEMEAWAATSESELTSLGAAPVFDERRREIRRALAASYHRDLGRPDDALRHLRALLDGDSIGDDERSRLELDCLALLRAAGDSVELERRLALHLERHGDQGALWLELASMREQQLHAHAGAMHAWQRALDCEAESRPALRGLRRTAEYLGRWSDVADALQLELDHSECTGASERAALLRRLGDICWHRLETTTRASRCYAAATEADPRDFAALRALERLLEAMEDWAGAADLYESEIEILGDEDAARTREVWLRIASIVDEQLDDLPRARTAYAHAAKIAPLRRRRLLRSAELHERAEDAEAFARAFAAWCDADDTVSNADDHLRLATCFESLERREEALQRTRKALEIAPGLARAWASCARLEEGLGDNAASAEALAREAELVTDENAAALLLRATHLLEPEDGMGALELVRTAVARAPGHPAVHAARACVAFSQALPEEALEAASEALALECESGLDPEQVVTVACVGGDAARVIGHLDAAAALYAQALDADPESEHAAGAQGETLAALGDYDAARRVLEARLDRGDDYPERAQHTTTLGECLEARGALEDALGRYEAAIALEPHLEEALEGAVRVREALEHLDEGIAAIERWAAATPIASLVGERLLRAALWEREVGSRNASAERHLRAALRADHWIPAAWISLCSLLFEEGRFGEVVRTVDEAAAWMGEDEELSALALLQAHAHEAGGERRDAAGCFGLAWEADPRCGAAVLAHARLLRGFGEWQEAGATLERFIAQYPEPQSSELAEIHEQLGRLQAGPLEQIDAAIASYRRAVHHDPERTRVRASLAELLSHRPDDWDEALFHHRIVLAADPTNAGALRVALRVAKARRSDRSVADGLRILRALGVAAPHELDAIPEGNLASGSKKAELEDPLHEKVRCMIAAASSEIADALDASVGTGDNRPAGDSSAETRFRARALNAAGNLTSPAVLTLPTPELAELAGLLAAIALDADEIRGDGHLINALSGTLRRRQRRKLRRLLEDTSSAEIEGVDFDLWRVELRALAAWSALREGEEEFRTALIALVRDEHEGLDDEVREDADLSELVAESPVARALLRRIVFRWLDDIR